VQQTLLLAMVCVVSLALFLPSAEVRHGE